MGKVLSDHAIQQANQLSNGDALVRYFEDRIEPGSAFRAILENNLMGVFNKADSSTLKDLPFIMSWLYNYAPANLFGSKEAVSVYLSRNDIYMRSLETV